MDQKRIAGELDALADRAEAELLDRLPRDQNSRFAFFREATRVVYTRLVAEDDASQRFAAWLKPLNANFRSWDVA